jgi:hypothetical protein
MCLNIPNKFLGGNEMTKEQFQARLEVLQHSRAQAQANVHAHDGAIEECTFWLKQFDVSTPPIEGPSVNATPAS